MKFRFLGHNTSVLLDLVRFSAASVVAIFHLGGFVQTGRVLPGAGANAAVCVFFVLSGFVIRFVTVSRRSTARDYFIDRASRIYSVVVPAILFTILFEGVAFLHNPAVFHQIAQPYRWADVPWQVFANLTFISGWWGYGVAPLSNLPFWSLTFECVYYVLYGLIHYTRKSRWILVPLILILVGPSIALLFPVWWMGVWLFDGYRYLSSAKHGPRFGAILAFIVASVCILSRHPLLNFLHATDVNWRRAQASHLVSSTRLSHLFSNPAATPWFDRLSLSFYFTGTAFSVALLALALLLDRQRSEIPKPVGSWIRTIADSTFTLYLLHVPFFIFLFSVTGLPSSWIGGTAAFLLAVALCVILAIQFDHLKLWLRNSLHRTCARFDPQKAISQPGSRACP